MAGETLRSARIEVPDPLAAIETYFEKGWTDGLPVVPPTEERILAMLDAMGKQPGDVLGEIPARARIITAEKLAINAIMAGCLPAYAPVLLAVIEALCDPAFSAHGPTASTSGMGILTVVNGPITSLVGLNAGENLFGPGWRANATIGRALRLLLRNVCGALPGTLDRSCFGHPGKFTYCIAEDEARSPWTPLHAERGIPAAESAVTLFAGEAPHQVANQSASDPEAILCTIADAMVGSGRLSLSGQQFVLIVAGEHRRRLAAQGWTKQHVREWLHEHAWRSEEDLARVGRLPAPETPEQAARQYRAVSHPDDILVVAAGGEAGGYSVVIPGWSGKLHSEAVTKMIPPCPTCLVEA
ncbi:MAG TPA: hypothetical protein VLM91_17505 [Candidatus Methylomirabilis sp.]|nr:hypothetical protein [Candidatus Methylomirabilis sp.]